MGNEIERKGISSGRYVKENDEVINIADIIEALAGKIPDDPASETSLAALLLAVAEIASETTAAAILAKLEAGIDTTLTGSSVTKAFAVTPHDTNVLTNTTIALYVGVDGDVKVDLEGVGTGIIFKNLSSGVFYPIKATKVYATGTTATNIIGVY